MRAREGAAFVQLNGSLGFFRSYIGVVAVFEDMLLMLCRM